MEETAPSVRSRLVTEWLKRYFIPSYWTQRRQSIRQQKSDTGPARRMVLQKMTIFLRHRCYADQYTGRDAKGLSLFHLMFRIVFPDAKAGIRLQGDNAFQIEPHIGTYPGPPLGYLGMIAVLGSGHLSFFLAQRVDDLGCAGNKGNNPMQLGRHFCQMTGLIVQFQAKGWPTPAQQGWQEKKTPVLLGSFLLYPRSSKRTGTLTHMAAGWPLRRPGENRQPRTVLSAASSRIS